MDTTRDFVDLFTRVSTAAQQLSEIIGDDRGGCFWICQTLAAAEDAYLTGHEASAYRVHLAKEYARTVSAIAGDERMDPRVRLIAEAALEAVHAAAARTPNARVPDVARFLPAAA